MSESTENALVLIVDDTPANLDLLTQVLRSNHYRVRAVPSGQMALDSARLSPPDLVLLDIKMPEMDGYQACQIMKADETLCDIPVIFISALDDAWDKVKAFRVGGSDYLTKPFQAEEVLVRVGQQIRLRRSSKQLREHAQNLEMANLKLLEIDKMRQSLTSMLVHDLRSPLQGIGLLLSLYSRKQEVSDVNLRLGEQAVQDMEALLNDLLEVFRATGADLALDVQELNLFEISRQAHLAQLPLASDRQILMNLELPPPLPRLLGDPRLVARALENLLSNAIKYTPRGGRVCIRLEEQVGSGLEKHQSWVVLSVQDSGRGIPPEQLPFIFDPFHQALSKDARHGFGLGLAIVQRIMASHRGRATVQSQVGVGSQFSLWFPQSQELLPRLQNG